MRYWNILLRISKDEKSEHSSSAKQLLEQYNTAGGDMLNNEILSLIDKYEQENRLEDKIMAKKDKSVSETIERIASGKRAPVKPSVLTEIKAIESFKQWEAFCKKYSLSVAGYISHRGGTLGTYTNQFKQFLSTKAESWMMPAKLGVYCNYLGGGLRGSINAGGYNEKLPAKDATLVDAWCEACERAYLSYEKGDGDDEIVPDDAIGTGYGRVNVKSAY